MNGKRHSRPKFRGLVAAAFVVPALLTASSRSFASTASACSVSRSDDQRFHYMGWGYNGYTGGVQSKIVVKDPWFPTPSPSYEYRTESYAQIKGALSSSSHYATGWIMDSNWNDFPANFHEYQCASQGLCRWDDGAASFGSSHTYEVQWSTYYLQYRMLIDGSDVSGWLNDNGNLDKPVEADTTSGVNSFALQLPGEPTSHETFNTTEYWDATFSNWEPFLTVGTAETDKPNNYSATSSDYQYNLQVWDDCN